MRAVFVSAAILLALVIGSPERLALHETVETLVLHETAETLAVHETAETLALHEAVARGFQPSAGRQVHLTLPEGTNMAAALSPNGRTIAIDLLGTLWTMPGSGGSATAITDMFLDARQPSWSPDGRRIAFQAYRDSTWQIWTVNADGTDLKPVTSTAYDDREPAWSPDGTR